MQEISGGKLITWYIGLIKGEDRKQARIRREEKKKHKESDK